MQCCRQAREVSSVPLPNLLGGLRVALPEPRLIMSGPLPILQQVFRPTFLFWGAHLVILRSPDTARNQAELAMCTASALPTHCFSPPQPRPPLPGSHGEGPEPMLDLIMSEDRKKDPTFSDGL